MSQDLRVLFVNKDATNLRSKKHRTQVNSFVQNKQNRVLLVTKNATNVRSKDHGAQVNLFAQNKQKRGTAEQSHQLKMSLSTIRCSRGSREYVHDPTASTDVIKVPTFTNRPLLNDPTCMYILQEQLDPFIRLAGKTTRHERNLLHHCKYLTIMVVKLTC